MRSRPKPKKAVRRKSQKFGGIAKKKISEDSDFDWLSLSGQVQVAMK
jgi:hypothetical protein